MVREVPLTRGYVALVDDEDFERAMQHSWCAHMDNGNIYARSGRTGARDGALRLHRFIMRVSPGELVDHRDGNGLNCTKANLRRASVSQNNANRRRAANRPFKGITFEVRRGKWKAAISHQGKKRFVGYFSDPSDAATAYDLAARRLHGAFARVNFPGDGEVAA